MILRILGSPGLTLERKGRSHEKIHDAFAKCVIPKLNPWPLPNSIVIMDNAKIHMYKELEDSVYQCEARLFFTTIFSAVESSRGLFWLVEKMDTEKRQKTPI